MDDHIDALRWRLAVLNGDEVWGAVREILNSLGYEDLSDFVSNCRLISDVWSVSKVISYHE